MQATDFVVAKHGIGDVVGREGEAVDFDQQRFIGKRICIRQLRFDEFAVPQIMAGNDEVGGIHGSTLGCSEARIFAFTYERFATRTLFETAFAFSAPAITPSRFLRAR